MNLIKKLLFKLFPRKRRKYFLLCKKLHRDQLLQALQLISQPEIRNCLEPQREELLKLLLEEFGIDSKEYLK